MNDSSELSKLPDWLIEWKANGKPQKPRKYKAPSGDKAVEYLFFSERQGSNRPIEVLNVREVKKP